MVFLELAAVARIEPFSQFVVTKIVSSCRVLYELIPEAFLNTQYAERRKEKLTLKS